MCSIKSSWAYFLLWSEFVVFTFCHFFPASFASERLLNKDPTVWLDGARPATTSILPSFLGIPLRTHPQKYLCKYNKISKVQLFHLYKSEKDFNKLTFYYSEFVNYEIWCFYKSYERDIKRP